MRTHRCSVTGMLLLIAVFVVACGQQSGAPPTPGIPAAGPTPAAVATVTAASTSTPASSAQAPADTLRWSLEGISDLSSIDPAKPGDAPTITVINLIFGGLIRLDDKLEVQPDNATEWKVSDDGTTYTFTIRDGLMFADGTPVTAADFAYSINRALAPETASHGAPFQLGHIVGAQDVVDGKAKQASGVRAVDDKTLEIKLDGPLAYFLS